MIDVVAGAVMSPAVRHAKRALESNRHPGKIGATRGRPGKSQRRREGRLGQKDRTLHRLVRIGRRTFADDVVGPVDFVMPRAAVPVVIAGEAKLARRLEIERHVEVVGLLIQKCAGVGVAIAAGPVVGAAHIRPQSDSLDRPLIPLPHGIQTNRDFRQIISRAALGPRSHPANSNTMEMAEENFRRKGRSSKGAPS